MKRLVIIDGFNFIFRAYYAVRPLTRKKDGLNTNALYGFTQMLLKVVSDLNPDLCCVALDCTPTFRHKLFPEYKGHRKEVDPEMLEQLPYLQPMIDAFGISALKVENYEADDVIATLTERYKHDYEITILSSDKDLMQLLDTNVQLYDTMKDKTVGIEGSTEKFGVTPDKVIEVQSLIGDSSDNIPGVKGIGPKTAEQLINQYGDLDGLYAHVEEITKPKLKQSLIDNKEMAYLSKQLVTLIRDVDIDVSLEDLNFTPTAEAAVAFLKDMEFNRLTERAAKVFAISEDVSAEIIEESPKNKAPENVSYETIDDADKLASWVKKIKKSGLFAVDTETTGLNPHTAELVGISLSVKAGEAGYIPLSHKGDMLSGIPKQLEKKEVFEALSPLFLDENIRKVGQNIKYDLHILSREGYQLNGIEDTMLMSACLDAGLNNHGMDTLAELHLGHTCVSFKEVAGTGKKQITFDYVDMQSATRYAAEDADITLRLYHFFKERLDLPQNAGVKKVYETIERPLIPVLEHMENTGIMVDQAGLAKLASEFDTRMTLHKNRVFEMAGQEFNLNSPKQLGEILFDKLELPANKKRSTKADVLEKLAEDFDICKEIMAYRGLAKLQSTYVDGLKQQMNPRTGRVHTSYNQVGAATGRFSSSDPNLQNIPSRSEDGRKIRKQFIAAKGYKILCADYSQIELRLLAHLSGSEGLLTAFREGHDIHAFTASQIFDVPLADVTSAQRSAAKAINFGLVYGMGKYSLAKHIGVSNDEAAKYIESYFSRYAGVRRYLEGFKEQAHDLGYIETMFGRRVHFPNINDRQPMMRAGSERAAINAPLQGANADIIKMVMPKIEKALIDGGYKAKMLLQVHDELVFEVPDAEVEVVTKLVTDLMTNVVKLDVPLDVGADVADNWEEAH